MSSNIPNVPGKTLERAERNHGLSIIKSRGSKHSNQQRKLIFDDTDITLGDSSTQKVKAVPNHGSAVPAEELHQ